MPNSRRWLRSSLLLPLFLFGCVVDSARKESATDTTNAAPVVTATPVNHGTHGMAEEVRWLFSPDRKALLVVADPAGVENEPVPDAFFFGDESRGFQTQMDSVWDVAPSPDWKWLGFSRAYTVVGGGGSGSELLTDAARRTAIDTATLRAGSFPASGMSMSRAIAQAGVIHIPDNPRAQAAADSAAPRLFPVALGWRVRWTTDGSTLALGNNPASARDDAQSETWAALDPTTGMMHGSLPANAKLADLKFTRGPTLDPSLPIDLTQSPSIPIQRGDRRYTIESRRGVITIADPNPPGATGATGAERVVGAGVALAATAGGRYIIALAPRSRAAQGEPAVEPVVYTVVW
ncbi:MAG: hypothetical protein ACJ8AK_07810 [Gemmatimonadaceae bacterium]